MHNEEGDVPEDIYVSLLQSNFSSVPLAQRSVSATNTKITSRLAITHVFFRVYTRNSATILAIKHIPSVFQLACLPGRGGGFSSPTGPPTLTDDFARLWSQIDATGSFVGPSQSRPPFNDYPTSVPSSIGPPSSILVALFNRIRKTHLFTTVSFTALMRALVSRRAYQRAIETWHEMLAEGHPISRIS